MWGYSDPFEMFNRGQNTRRQKPKATWDPFGELRKQPNYEDEEDEEEQQRLAYEEALKREEENQRRMQEAKQRKFDDKHKKKQDYLRQQQILQKQQEEENRKLMLEEQLQKQEEEKRLAEEKKRVEREKWLQYASQPEVQQKSAQNLQKVWRGRAVRLTNPLANLRNLTKIESQISAVVAKVPLELVRAKSISILQEKKKSVKNLLLIEEELTRLMISLDSISGKNPIVRERRKNSVALCQKTVDAIDPLRKDLARQVYELEQEEKLKQEQTPPTPEPQSMETSAATAASQSVVEVPKEQESESEVISVPVAMEMASEPLENLSPESQQVTPEMEQSETVNQPEIEAETRRVVPIEDEHKSRMEKRILELETETATDKKNLFEVSQSNIQLQLRVDQLEAQLKAKTSTVDLQQQRILHLEQELAKFLKKQ